MSSSPFDPSVLLRRMLTDQSGEDLVETALLGAIVGLASIAVWKLLASTVGSVYSNADTDTQKLSGCTPNPGGSGCP